MPAMAGLRGLVSWKAEISFHPFWMVVTAIERRHPRPSGFMRSPRAASHEGAIVSNILIAALLFVLGASCRPPMTSTTPANPAWSAPSGGLRARLVTQQGQVRAGESLRIDIELENVGSVPLRVVLDDPFAFSPRLEDAAGREIAPTGSRAEVLSSPREETIAPGHTVSAPLATPHEDTKAELDLTTSMWQLAPGRYRLSGRFAGTGDAGTWTGTLDLPPLLFEVS